MGLQLKGTTRNHVVIIPFTAFVAAMLWRPILDPFLHREQYRGEVRALYDSVHLGMNKQMVAQEMAAAKYPHLDFHKEGELWSASAPLQFGAGNWVLVVEFRGDEVFAVRVRTADGVEKIHHPEDAPVDKTASVAPK
jgi:membrane protein implicated in regulation of membrane protease activity